MESGLRERMLSLRERRLSRKLSFSKRQLSREEVNHGVVCVVGLFDLAPLLPVVTPNPFRDPEIGDYQKTPRFAAIGH